VSKYEMSEVDTGKETSRLCYISGEHGYHKDDSQNWTAFFTTKPLSEQWGDDWNDAPYECNAGWPYLPSKWFEAYDSDKKKWVKGSDYEDGVPKWRIYMVSFATTDYCLPCSYSVSRSADGHGFSVDLINQHEAAWLWPSCYSYMEAVRCLIAGEQLKPEPIFAGITLAEFCSKIVKTGKLLSVEEYVRDE
jgi:hypothetical protein